MLSNTSATYKVVGEKSATTLQNVNWTVEGGAFVQGGNITGEICKLSFKDLLMLNPQEEIKVIATLEDGTVLTKSVVIKKAGLIIQAEGNIQSGQSIGAGTAKYTAYFNGELVSANWTSESKSEPKVTALETSYVGQTFVLPTSGIMGVSETLEATITAEYESMTATSKFKATNS